MSSTTNIPPSPLNIGTVQAGDPAIIVPSFSAWFSTDAIHEIERTAFAEIIDGPDALAYREFRNYMINAYRSRPWEYLSLTSVRRNLNGDVAFLVKIHAFLEQWGLINYTQLTSLPSEAPKEIAWQLPKDHRLAHGLSLPEIFGLEIDCPGCTRPVKGVFYALVDRNQMPDVTAIRCNHCFLNGNLPVGKNSADYVRVDPLLWSQGAANWTEQDTLKLLEILEELTVDDSVNWDAVAESLGKRKELCIWQFLRLPFPKDCISARCPEEDSVMDSSHLYDSASMPFAFVRNPTMALLTFLASQVHPQVAAAAAKYALEQVQKSTDQTPVDSSYLATTTLALAAVKAKQLADTEQARIASLHDNLVALQLRKVQQKMAQLEALAKGIEDEKKSVEAQRVAVFYERYKLFSKMKELGHQ